MTEKDSSFLVVALPTCNWVVILGQIFASRLSRIGAPRWEHQTELISNESGAKKDLAKGNMRFGGVTVG